MFNSNCTQKRVKALAALTSLAAFGFLGAAPAMADADPGTGTLTIEPLPAPNGSVIIGATVTITPLSGIDLSTNAGWAKAQTVTLGSKGELPETLPDGVSLGTSITMTTTAGQAAVFENLPIGLYYVTETGMPAGSTVTKPFLVTIPLAVEDDSNTLVYTYDVTIYPKATQVTVAKANNGSAVTLGQLMGYTIAADIPLVADGSPITAYQIKDSKGSGQGTLTFDGAITVAFSEGANGSLETSDYTISNVFTAANLPAVNNQLYFQIDFTADGLAKLAAQPAGVQVLVTYKATVQTSDNLDLGGDADTFTNVVTVAASAESVANPTDYPPATAQDDFVTGQYLIYKTDGNGAPLNGAEFQIYALSSYADCSTAVANSSPITMQFTNALGEVGAYGTVTQASSDANTALDSGLNGYGKGYLMTGELVYGQYCAVETVAPAGYEIADTPFAFTAEASDSMGPWNTKCMADGYTTITKCYNNGANQFPIALTAENTPMANGFELPLTGWNGVQTSIAAFGLVFLAGATTYVVTQRRNLAHQA